MPAMTAMKYNKHLSEFYQRLLSNGKPKMVALIAVYEKITCFVCRHFLIYGVPFDQNWLAKKQEQNFTKILLLYLDF